MKKPPGRTSTDPTVRKAVGLDLGGTFIKVGLVDEKGRILRKAQFPTRTEDGKKQTVLRQIEKAVDFALAECGAKGIVGIGIGTPGLVDNRGRVYEAPNLPAWHNVPLQRLMEKRYGVPVTVENDVNSITWGEYLFGAGKGSRTMICITLGTGLGGGVVINGRLLRGTEYSAAEIGHLTIDYRGPRCNCGSIGCIERFVGRDYIVERAVEAIRNGRHTLISRLAGGDAKKITPKVISEAYRKGDGLAKEIWRDVGECLGAMFVGLVNLFNPDTIVIGGGIAQTGGILFDTVRRRIRKHAMKKLSACVRVVPAGLGTDTGVISAAALILYGRTDRLP